MKSVLNILIFVLAIPIVFGAIDPVGGNSCKTFRTGKFKMVDKDLNFLIERDQKIQTETDVKNNAVAKFKINWVSACEYELNILEGSEKLMAFFKNKTLVIRILETYDTGYKYEAKLKGIEGGAVVHTVERIR